MTEVVFTQAKMFGSLTKGGHIQVREVCVGPDADSAEPTGILITAVKQTRSDQWKETISIDDVEFPSVDAALEHWRSTQ